VVTVVGPEYVTGSSRMKSGTATKLILNMLSTALMIKSGRVEGNRMVNLQPTNHKLTERSIRMLMEKLKVPEKKARQLLLKYGTVKAVLDTQR
jgi:N-acetylmuramic acid 6-phosphate etherase